jgi:hypothetical protein
MGVYAHHPVGLIEEVDMRAAVIAGLVAGFTLMAGAVPALAAGNPSGTGLPSQSCQDIVAGGGTEPGNSSSSPGSPFNEPSSTSAGGIGGQHYNETSQYDVACFQVSQH